MEVTIKNSEIPYQIVKNCRICFSIELYPLKNFGEFASCGHFLNDLDCLDEQGVLNLVVCKNCLLVQLDRNFTLSHLFNSHYGYQSSLNESMVDHLRTIVTRALNYFPEESQINILDIGANDGTLLNLFDDSKKCQNLVGIDPTLEKYKKNYPSRALKLEKFFDEPTSLEILEFNKGQKFEIISSIAMFYDLAEIHSFMKGIDNLLTENGLWIIEVSYLYNMIKANAIDTVCHEHIEYYSAAPLNWLMKHFGFKVVACELNEVNGASIQLIIARKKSKYEESKFFQEILKNEPESIQPIQDLFHEMLANISKNVEEVVAKALAISRKTNASIFGLGASTKGNFVLQCYPKLAEVIECIGEINSNKFNKLTPGTRIPIRDEKQILSKKDAIFIVLPWHFKTSFLNDYEKVLKQINGTLIFMMPNVEVISF